MKTRGSATVGALVVLPNALAGSLWDVPAAALGSLLLVLILFVEIVTPTPWSVR